MLGHGEVVGPAESMAGPLGVIDEIPGIRMLDPLDCYHAERVALSRLLLADSSTRSRSLGPWGSSTTP